MRVYASHRRAYTPRLWPRACSAPASGLRRYCTLTTPTVEAIAIGAGAALVVGVRPWRFKRSYPIITPARYITDLRRNAHWNLAMPTVPHGRDQGA